MTTTLYAANLLDSPAGLALAAAIGFGFGYFLERAGFGSSRKLTAIFYFRDMAVLKVMFTAVVTALVGYQYLVRLGWADPSGLYVLDTYWGPQVVGGLLFGAGFVVGGWCPGTALVGLASAKFDALVFLVGAGLGSILFNEFYPVIERFYTSGHRPALLLGDALGVPARVLPLAVSLLAVGMFAGATWLERRFGGEAARTGPRFAPGRLAAAGVLILLAAGLLLPGGQGGVAPSAPGAAPSTVGILAEVDEAREHVEPAELAADLMRGAADLLVVDTRTAAEYAAFHIRGAVHIPLPELRARAPEWPRDRRIVLYSNGTTHAAQAWLDLRREGWENVRVLTDGVVGFWRDVLTPPSLSSALDPEVARSASAAYAARRAYFVEGRPAPAPAAAPDAAPPATPAAMQPPGPAQHLVSTAWLAERLGRPEVKVLDVRAESTMYNKAHIPGALYLNVENLRTTLGGVHSMLAPAEDIARTLGRLGIRPDDTVVILDDRVRDATLMAVALERVGHASYAVLHGGFKAWAAEGRPVTAALPSVTPAAYPAPSGPDGFTVSLDEANRLRQDGKTVVLDVRPAEFFSGRKVEEARGGRIPGAVNRPYTDDVIKDTALWRDADALRAAYAGLGIGPDTPVVVHCRTGHQASQTYFLLKHLLGVKSVKWMDASWLGWAARADMPVESDAR